MEVQVAETGPCSRALPITVPPKQVNEHLDQMYESARQQIHIKGFRPGKVPRDLIQKRYGAGILAEAKEQMLNRFFGEACRSKDLSPVGRVAIDDIEKLEVKPDAKLEFTAKIDVRPVFEIKKAKAIEVDSYEATPRNPTLFFQTTLGVFTPGASPLPTVGFPRALRTRFEVDTLGSGGSNDH